jgi:hypothetical protein
VLALLLLPLLLLPLLLLPLLLLPLLLLPLLLLREHAYCTSPLEAVQIVGDKGTVYNLSG